MVVRYHVKNRPPSDPLADYSRNHPDILEAATTSCLVEFAGSIGPRRSSAPKSNVHVKQVAEGRCHVRSFYLSIARAVHRPHVEISTP
jgi:hypothetical protein